jgi:hypothetical protein
MLLTRIWNPAANEIRSSSPAYFSGRKFRRGGVVEAQHRFPQRRRPEPRHDRARLPDRECRQSGDHHRAARTGRTNQSTALITMCASGQSSTGTIVERI